MWRWCWENPCTCKKVHSFTVHCLLYHCGFLDRQAQKKKQKKFYLNKVKEREKNRIKEQGVLGVLCMLIRWNWATQQNNSKSILFKLKKYDIPSCTPFRQPWISLYYSVPEYIHLWNSLNSSQIIYFPPALLCRYIGRCIRKVCSCLAIIIHFINFFYVRTLEYNL